MTRTAAQQPSPATPDDVYLTAAHLQARYGNVSASWIKRRQKSAGFPEPATDFGTNRRYWLLSDILAWETSRRGRKGVSA